MKLNTQSKLIAAAFAPASILPVTSQARPKLCTTKPGALENCLDRNTPGFCETVSIDEACMAFVSNRMRTANGKGTITVRESDARKAALCLELFQERLNTEPED